MIAEEKRKSRGKGCVIALLILLIIAVALVAVGAIICTIY
jgi:flagellar basal body-associated protein FliL